MADSYTKRVTIFINGKQIENNIKSIRKEMYKLTAQQAKMTRGSKEYTRTGAEIKRLDRILQQHRQGIKATGGAWQKIKGFLPIAGFVSLAAAVKGVLRNAIETRKEFSRYNAVLKVALGSQREANKEFDKLQKFAATTPFQLNELTGSYVKLTNYGLKPTMEDLENYGDLASSVGKGFDQLVEAIADATTFEFERLKEFGIRSQKEGDTIKFTFKGITTEVEAEAQAVKNYIAGLGNLEGVAGSMEEISKTIGGALSNAGDSADKMFNTIGKRLEPGLVKLLGTFGRLTSIVERWVRVPVEKELENERTQVNVLVTELLDANTEEGRRRDILNELKAISPKIVKGLEEENLNVGQLQKNLALYNQELTNRIILANLEEEEEKKLAKLAKARTDLAENQTRAVKFMNDALDINKEYNQILYRQLSEIYYSEEDVLTKAKQFRDILVKGEFKGGIIDIIKDIEKAQKVLDKEERRGAEISKRIQTMKEMLGLIEDINNKEITNEQIEILKKENKLTEDQLKLLNEKGKLFQKDLTESQIKYLENYRVLTEKEIKAREKALERLKEIEHEYSLSKIDANERELQQIRDKYDKEIEAAQNAGLTKEQIEGIEAVKRQELRDKEREQDLEWLDETIEEENRKLAEQSDDLLKIWDKYYNKLQEKRKKDEEEQLKTAEKYKAIASSIVSYSGNLLNEFLQDGKLTTQEFAAFVILSLLNSLRAHLRAKEAEFLIKSIATFGPVAGGIRAGIGITAMEVAFAAAETALKGYVARSNKTEQQAKGKYDVIGADDGRSYNAGYHGPVDRTQLFTRPTLVAERGGELVFDAQHTRQLMLNPDLLGQVMALRGVPQRAEGNYPQAGQQTTPVQQVNTEDVKALLQLNVALLNKLSQGVRAYIVYDDIRDAEEFVNKVEGRASGN